LVKNWKRLIMNTFIADSGGKNAEEASSGFAELARPERICKSSLICSLKLVREFKWLARKSLGADVWVLGLLKYLIASP